MSTSSNNMPARIWAGRKTGWTADRTALFEKDTIYTRADIVERLAKALDGLVQRFDTFDGQPFVNPADSPWAIARSALAAYRESINDEA